MTIIFMYNGPLAGYLEYTLKAAVNSSRNHRVICISDRTYNAIGVEYYDWDTYAAGTKWFEDITKFPEDDVFHRLSFVRPAVLRNFCQQNGIDRFFNADADVIVTEDLDPICSAWYWCKFTISMCDVAKMFVDGVGECSIGHTNHSILTLDAIEEYIQFVRDYGASGATEKIGCDMMAWSRFAAKTRLPWCDTSSVLDHNIGSQLDKYHNDGECKYLAWHDRKPFKVRMSDNAEEPMPIIHCWSGTKRYIGDWCKRLWT